MDKDSRFSGLASTVKLFNPSPYRYDSASLHIIARKLEAEPDLERQLLGAGLRRMADKIHEIAKEDEGRL